MKCTLLVTHTATFLSQLLFKKFQAVSLALTKGSNCALKLKLSLNIQQHHCIPICQCQYGFHFLPNFPYPQETKVVSNHGYMSRFVHLNYNYDFKTPKILYFPPSLSIYLFLSYYITITPFFLYYYHTSHLFINIYSVFLLYILSSKLSIRRQMSALYTLNSLHNDFLCK